MDKLFALYHAALDMSPVKGSPRWHAAAACLEGHEARWREYVNGIAQLMFLYHDTYGLSSDTVQCVAHAVLCGCAKDWRQCLKEAQE